MRENERLYEAIEEAARTKDPVRLRDGETLRTTMIDSTKFLVEDLLWKDERGHIYQVILEAGFERKGGLFLSGMYVFGNKEVREGFGSGRKTMFRINNRYNGPV